MDVYSRIKEVSLKKYRIKWDDISKSKFQQNVKHFFKPYWHLDNCVEEFPVLGTKLRCDIINFDKMIAVEVDGNFHNRYSSFHHKNRVGFLNSLKRDSEKESWLKLNKIFIIRINENDFKFLNFSWLKDNFNIDINDKYVYNSYL